MKSAHDRLREYRTQAWLRAIRVAETRQDKRTTRELFTWVHVHIAIERVVERHNRRHGKGKVQHAV